MTFKDFAEPLSWELIWANFWIFYIFSHFLPYIMLIIGTRFVLRFTRNGLPGVSAKNAVRNRYWLIAGEEFMFWSLRTAIQWRFIMSNASFSPLRTSWYHCIFLASYLTHYNPVLLFYTLWKHQKTFWFSVFTGYRKATPGCNGLTESYSETTKGIIGLLHLLYTMFNKLLKVLDIVVT